MNKSIKNKLLHFYTSGNIYDDFAESRTKKTAKLRQIIRACFYAHCAAAVLCIVLAAVLHAGLGIIAVTVCEVILATMAFLAVGDMTLMKTLLFCGDLAFAAAMFITGTLSDTKAPFFAVGAVSIVAALIAIGAFFAALCKIFLECFSPLAIRREHYTLLPNFSSDTSNDNPDMPYDPDARDMQDAHDAAAPEETVTVPAPRSEFQILADKLKEIFHAPKKEKASDNTDAMTAEQTAPNTQSQTEVTE